MTKTNNRSFAVFILTHGRHENCVTHITLKKAGYTGKIYFIVDDTDKSLEDYKEKFGESVIVFNKRKAIEITDAMDNLKKTNSVVYARNYSFVIAKELGLDYFWQLDDDYTTFRHTFDENLNYITSQSKITNLDALIDAILDYMDSAPIHSLAFSQGGDFIGGEGSGVSKVTMAGGMHRKVMNSFFFKTDRPVCFMGRINEDVNMYVDYGKRGYVFGTIGQLRLEQKQTQSNAGGLTDVYLDLGTYVKSLYTVLINPSCVVVNEMGDTHRRLHHRVNWRYAVPKIIGMKHKKVSNE